MKDFLDSLINPDQKSEDWHNSRLGRFTSSEIYKLMSPAMRDMTEEELANRPKKGTGSRTTTIEEPSLLSAGAITYVRVQVAETLTGIHEEIYSAALDWGKTYEPEAREALGEYLKTISPEMEIKENGFVEFSTIAGGSTDGDVFENDQMVAITEIKCPYNSANHVNNLVLVTADNATEKLKEIHPEYYWQMQSNMLWNKVQQGYFASYDPRFPDGTKLLVVLIEANPDDQERILIKIESAEILKQETLKTIKENGN